MKTTEKKELSYYRLRLTAYLKDYHPHKVSDENFINERADLAAKTYEESYLDGSSTDLSEADALEVLFKGLHFSEFNLLEQILENEFTKDVPSELTSQLCSMLINNLAVKDTINKYVLEDNFDEKPEYELLYTELTGVIQQAIEDNKLLENLKA